MKRTNAVLSLAAAGLLFCASAFAQPEWKSIEELRKETPAHWTQTYETPWRTIEVDVPIDIPDVDNMPIFKVTYEAPVDYAICEGYKVTENGEHDYDQGLFRAERGKDPQKLQESEYDSAKVRRQYYREDSEMAYIYENYRVPLTKDEYWLFDGRIPDVTAEALELSAAEAYELALEEARHFIGDQVDSFRLCSVVVTNRHYKCRMEDNERIWERPVSEHGQYNFEWKQTFGGVDYEPAVIFESYANTGGINEARGSISISTDGMGFFGVYLSRFAQKDMPYEDVPLQPFDAVQAALEEEIMKGKLRRVNSVKLCYVGYDDPEDKTMMWLFPTWLVTGTIEENVKKETVFECDSQGYIITGLRREYVFPAQSGKMMDRESRSRNRRVVQDIVTWDDVKK